MTTWIWGLLGLHALVAVVAPLLARRIGHRVLVACAVAPAATLAWSLAVALRGTAPSQQRTGVTWIEGLDLGLTARIDSFALLWVAMISAIGVAVFAYSSAYLAGHADVGAFAARLTGFAGAMIGVVVADDLLLVYVAWELTSVFSYLLIATDDRRAAPIAAARQALVVTAGGGLCMLAGFVLLSVDAGTSSMSELAQSPPSGPAVSAAAALVLLGALTKSAQFPFHGWLPGAMAAPTPASAYLHSATMVKAGVYLVARFAPIFAVSVELWRPAVIGLGLVTMLHGGWVALRQTDLKLLLAYGTVSQLGLLVVLFGAGIASLTAAGIVMLVAHAAFKSALFLVVGIVDKRTGTRDLRELSGLARRLPVTCVAATLAAASMMGLPPLLGFVGKEKAFKALLGADEPWAVVVLLIAIVGSALTVAYSARFVWGAFGGSATATATDGAALGSSSGATTMTAAAVALSATGLVAGVVATSLTAIVEPAAVAVDPSAAGTTVVLWAGFDLALASSAVAVVVGMALFVASAGVVRLQERLTLGIGWAACFAGCMRALDRVARRTTGVVQNGSLPIYLGIIVVVVLGAPTMVLLPHLALGDGAVVSESALQLAACALALLAAVATVLSNRRFVAALAVGAVGYSVGLLFVIQGATDLALTQFLVETLSVVALVLVLRRLPERFPSVPWKLGRAMSVTVSAIAGLAVVALTLTAGSASRGPSVSDDYLARALPDGGGRNVVNVILTDFRALDTLGEIVVLAIAGLGVTSLVLGVSDRGDRPAMKAADSLLLGALVRIVVPVALVFAGFLLSAGHNAPGGGFVGGLVAGAALALQYARGGFADVARIVRVSHEALLGTGVAIAGLTGLAGYLVGDEFLEAGKLTTSVPVLGTVKATTALPFDIGVFLVVVGLVVSVLDGLGSRSDDDVRDEPGRDRAPAVPTSAGGNR
ncbi:hydrogen gas-evolving membrane-bound hydrogenase subunit E [Ilumatobacter sp.]|uniref:hydrogen gas-evolving membrane-bound hydrogenase subunit E n=1 Tax=Ilumatobacter sp. TaxID=1967498 RepID=UPI003B527BB2